MQIPCMFWLIFIRWVKDTLFLSIPERPGPPLKPGVVDYERSKALLEWTKPLKDGGYPITHYKVSWNKKYVGRYISIPCVIIKIKTFTVVVPK